MSSDNKHSVKSKAQAAAAKAPASEAARKERLGRKWACYSCGARFYDLNKPEPLCPKCNADQRQSPAAKAPATTKAKAKKKAAAAPPPPPPPPVKEVKKPRFADSEEEIGVAVDDEADDIAADLEEELAEDLEGEGFAVADTEGEAEDDADED